MSSIVIALQRYQACPAIHWLSSFAGKQLETFSQAQHRYKTTYEVLLLSIFEKYF
ncbi:hypothetical protein [Halomonas colorata]|uniref:Uncharacterized protein n=1 Tax=Halomonas colorata TaxID=2742615 RepID=A0ABR9G0M4_9GAMM|nr:hypothetical protein [Halomonas colorata]MBE0464469.1 hypothetical protein [Halomonas colorata]